MINVLFVKIFTAICKLNNERKGLFLWEWAFVTENVLKVSKLRKKIPSWTILKKEVNIVGSFREINELNNVRMMNRLPSFNFSFERMNKIFLRKAFIFARIYFLYQVLFWNHFASNDMSHLRIDTDVSWCETPCAQAFVLDLISTINHFQSRDFLYHCPLLFGLFTLHFKMTIFIK